MNGKAKGSAFERKIAKELSFWLTGGKDGAQLIRSVLSGGWSRGKAPGTESWRHVGDLAPNGPDGEEFRRRFAVECKHRRSIALECLWTRSSVDSLPGWWDKLRNESAADGLIPLLIYRANGMPIMVATSREFAEWLRVGQVAVFPWKDMTVFSFDALVRCSAARVLAFAPTVKPAGTTS